MLKKKKRKIKEYEYFQFNQETINEVETLFNDILSNDDLHSKLLYLNMLTSSFIENNVSNSLYSYNEIMCGIYILSKKIKNKELFIKHKFLRFPKGF
ncbi:hypothetical protein [Campylobacter sp. MG1]|uniref:hypothetical protein n=1 Tax=Campylobacter sp. MG1 TaxID=2976332 RepID=UPI00226C8697|nr:hypothetical protein [Campylobacter sp. MG1]